MKISTAFLFVMLAPAVGFADDLSSCAVMDADLDRLACYDRVSGRTPKSTPLVTDSKWRVDVRKSDFEDTKDVYVSVLSEQPIACGVLGQSDKANLMIRCSENTTSVFMITNCHVASGFKGYGEVDIRLDDDKSFKRNLDASTDNRALGLWSGAQSIPFIKQMLNKDQTLIRFTPFNKSKVTAEFEISGVEDAIAPLRESCGW